MLSNSNAYIGREFIALYEGKIFKEYKLQDPLLINLNRKEHTFIVAKSGSGKSYLAGVIAEELIRTVNNCSVVILDPIGIFSTLKYKNNGPEVGKWNSQLKKEEINPRGISNYKIWIPSGDIKHFTPSMYDKIFSLSANKISTSMLCFAFDMEPLDPQVRLYRKAQLKMMEENSNYSLSELEDSITNGDFHYKEQTIEALLSKLDALREIGLINSQHSVEINEIIKENEVIVFDLSMGSIYTSRIIVNFFAEQLLKIRKIATRKLRQAQEKNTKISIPEYIPPVQLVIDEAHNFLPKNPILKEYIKEGRNVGCMLTAISQSPDLTRDVYANIVHLFVGQLIFNEDILSVKAMIPIEKSPKEFREQVKSLNIGCFYYYNIDKKTEKKIIVRPRYTSHPAETELKDEKRYLISSDSNIEQKIIEEARQLTEEAEIYIKNNKRLKKIEQ